MKRYFYILGIVVAFGLLINLSSSLYKTYRASLQVRDLESEVRIEEQKKEALEQTLKGRNNLQYVEKQAREQLYMTKENEILAIIPEQKKSTDKSEQSVSMVKNKAQKSNYLLWKELFFE